MPGGRIDLDELALRLLQVKKALAQGATQYAACKQANIDPRTYKKYLKKESVWFKVGGRQQVDQTVLRVGREPYLSDRGMEIFGVFVHTMDRLGFPVVPATAAKIARKIRADQAGLPIEDVKPPSEPTLKRFCQEVEIEKRLGRKGEAIRAAKTKEEFLYPFFDLLEDLNGSIKPEAATVWNCDEVAVAVEGMSVFKLTTNRNVRYERPDLDHFTAMITTNAAGEVAPAFLIYKADSNQVVPHAAAHPHWATGNESAYMTAEDFGVWTIKFAEFLKRRPDSQWGRHVLIMDGHSSHLHPDSILTLASAGVSVICLPSHTTHVLQPNDSGTNKTLKSNINKGLQKHIEAQTRLSILLLTGLLKKALSKRNMKPAIINSFRHTGVWPVDRLQVAKLIRSERPSTAIALDASVRAAAGLVAGHLSTLNDLIRSNREAHSQQGRKRKDSFTKHAVVLTDPAAVARLQNELDYKRLAKLPVDKLVEQLQLLGVEEQWIMKEVKRNGVTESVPKTKKELLGVLQELIDFKTQELTQNIANTIQKTKVRCPSSLDIPEVSNGPADGDETEGEEAEANTDDN